MKVSQIISILNSKLKSVISKPGSYSLKVTNSQFYAPRGVQIINFAGVNAYQAGVITSLVAPFESYLTGDQDAEIDLTHDDAKGLNDALNVGISTSLLLNAAYVPQKGEIVKVTLGYVPMKDGSGDGLMVTNVSEIKAVQARGTSLNALFAKKETPAVIGQDAPKVEETVIP